MQTEVRELFVPSSDGAHLLRTVVVLPAEKPRGFFQIVHGMAEHIDRYRGFMTELAEAGYLAFGHDQLGHGRSALDGELGFIARREGDALLVSDVAAVLSAVRAEYGEGGEYILFGHSMGSFIARLAAADAVSPDRLILMGTGGRNPAAAPGIVLAGVISRLCGKRHISPLMNCLAFGAYNRRFRGEDGTETHLWLSSDAKARAAYYADPLSGFPFTVSAMRDLIRLQRRSNLPSWYRKLPTAPPILLLSGEDDPVGNYGKGVREVERLLSESGHLVTARLYSGARHEILNDFIDAQVLSDILTFLAE